MAQEASRPFAVFDIDGTLIRWQLYHAMADALAKHGHISTKSYAKLRDARMRWKQRTGVKSFNDYQVFVIKAYEDTLIKLSARQIEQAVEDVFIEYKDQVYIYTRDLIQNLKKEGFLLFAISGSQTEIIRKIADYYGFDDYTATSYSVKKGKLLKVFPSSDKKRALTALAAKNNVGFDNSLGVGDSAGDIPMLEMVEQPIAFNPEKELFNHAANEGWRIAIERKNMIYELEKRSGKYELAKTSTG